MLRQSSSAPTRTCNLCGQTKPQDADHYYSRLQKSGVRTYSCWCKVCQAAKTRARWAADPEAQQKDRARREPRREEIRAYDRMRAKRDREKKKIIIDRWHANNPQRSRALAISRSATRRAREKNIGGKWTADDVDRMMRGQKGRCWWCSKKLGAFHVDHRIPVAKDGTNDPSNLVLSCPPCNRSKSAKLPQEFAGRLF